MKANGFKIQLLVCVVTLFSQFATAEDTQNYQLAYSCVPQKVWDSGYHVKIVYDVAQKKYRTWVYEASFFGESLLFTKPMVLILKNQNIFGRHTFLFKQYELYGSNFIELTDIEHRHFKMKLILNGTRVDNSLQVLDCRVEDWFIQQFPVFSR